MTIRPRFAPASAFGAFALALSLCAAGAVSGLTLDDLAGRWRGEGALSLNHEPEQRLRCQIRFRSIGRDSSFFSGRCATAQAARSFTYMLTLAPGGVVLAENRMEPPESLPLTMQGALSADTLRFEEQGAALFELRLTGAGLEFRIEGDGPDGFARGQAQLLRIGAD